MAPIRGPRQKAYKIRLVLTSTDCALDPSPSCKLCNRVCKTRRVSNTLYATTLFYRDPAMHAPWVMHWNAMPRPRNRSPLFRHQNLFHTVLTSWGFSALSVAVSPTHEGRSIAAILRPFPRKRCSWRQRENRRGVYKMSKGPRLEHEKYKDRMRFDELPDLLTPRDARASRPPPKNLRRLAPVARKA